MVTVILLCSEDREQLKQIDLNKDFTLHFDDIGIIENNKNVELELYATANYVKKNINTNKIIVIKEKITDEEKLNSLAYIANVIYKYDTNSDTWSIEKFMINGNKTLYKQILNYLNRIE